MLTLANGWKSILIRVLVFFIVSVSLVGCAPRGAFNFDDEKLTQEQAVVQPIFVATNRRKSEVTTQGLFRQEFGDIRNAEVRFARMDISIPASHQLGRIEWPGYAKPDPNKHFVVQNQQAYDGSAAFMAAVNARENHEDVFVFVHGFNVNTAEAIYRLAQVAHDYQARIPVIAFSWPSAGSAQGYAYDRDSVMFSRDGLEELLTLLSKRKRRVYLIAHSMGSHLVMETLRQMSISGNKRGLEQLAAVALISPDIDEDVFKQQARRIDPLPKPFTLMVSQKDRALDLAAFLTGKPNRLGSIPSAESLDGLPISVIDLSAIEGGDGAGHATAFTSPEAIEQLRNW
ncbi:alpha/beta fold hydrolase [uncultured Pelagimonas sp.]|uniref:alpha/beta hydrolase n=1 Tax=uncultured Pelagimonas sp. TaxID=1618102 RepID=UPI00260DD7EE|nr:alpha/beta fold hydrolase [uncultured Pelagimonas sp.]